MVAILRKELADYFTSVRCLVLFLLVILICAGALINANQGIRSAGSEGFIFLRLFTTSGEILPSMVNIIALFFIPITGIALGFDAINSERGNGTLSRLLSQPVYRDSVINGKFLAGIITIAILMLTSLLLVSGYGLRMVGVPPTSEEIIRLFFYFVISLFYGAFWMGLSILFSVVFRRIATSLLVSIAVWLFFSIFWGLIGTAIANAIIPASGESTEVLVRNVELQQMIMRFSPNILFSEATTGLLHPVLLETSMGMVGAIASGQSAYMLATPLSLTQSLIVIWPHLTSLVGLGVICFAISYLTFMRQEIRAT